MSLTLQRTTAIDIPFVLAAERAVHAREFVTPWSEEQHAQAIVDEDQEHLLVGLDERLVGFVLLAGLASSPHSIELRRIVVMKTGVGLGRQAMQLVLARVFDAAHAHRVWLDVKLGNVRASRCYASLGFIEEGVLRDVLLAGGRRESLILMSLLRPEWESQTARSEDAPRVAIASRSPAVAGILDSARTPRREQHERLPRRAYEIRSATMQDIAAVLDLWVAAGNLPTVSDSPEGLARLLAADPQALLVAERGGVLAGTLIAAWDGWRGSFYRLAVSPEHRRGGLATMLLREGERRLRERGAVRLTAIVADDEEGAMGFWRAAGYQRQRHRARFVHHCDAAERGN